MAKKAKKPKKKKIKSLPTIRRRLFKLWSVAVRGRADYKCEFCGVQKGDLHLLNDKEITKLDAHHFVSRNIKDCPLKFDIRNGVSADPFCHKFGIPSFHRDPVTTITWLQNTRPEHYRFILENIQTKVDLDNRYILAEIEERLRAKEPLDIDRLKSIEKQFPRPKKKTKIKGSLFDEFASDGSSDSSSSSD